MLKMLCLILLATPPTLDQILSTSHTHVGIEVVSLKTGQTLYEKNANQLFVPASVLKLVTAAAALETLTPSFTFDTHFLTDGTLEKHTLRGNLYLKGSGDPSLTRHHLQEMVRALKNLSITQIEGDLIADATIFDSTSKGPGWMWDDVTGISFSPLSGLTLDHSCLEVWVKPTTLDSPPQVTLYPPTQCIALENLATTQISKQTLTIERALTKNNLIQVKGTLAPDSPSTKELIPIDNPDQYALEQLTLLLQEAQITLKGKPRHGQAPTRATTLVTNHSEPLKQLLYQVLKNTDNLYADALFKQIGAHTNTQGNWTNGSQAVRAFLEKLDITNVVALDGCGLSRYNLISPHQIVQLLTYMDKTSLYGPEFQSNLPLSDGTLKKRNLGPHVRAKTGCMSGICSLAGYITTKTGEKLAFAIMSSGFVDMSSERKLQDEICTFLVNNF